MNLQEALTNIAAQIKGDPAELIAYAALDTIGGYHPDEALRKWPMGSLWSVEGQMLYALVRHLKPQIVVQIGGWVGASAVHLSAAVRDNGFGKVISVDNESEGRAHGELFPAEFSEYVTFIRANGEDWLAEQADGSIGFVFEDASHDTALVATLSTLALQKLEPGGYLVNHDAGHDFAIVGGGVKVPSAVGRQVRDGLAQANAYFRVYRAEPSDCGIALTVKPGKKVTTEWSRNDAATQSAPLVEAPEPISNAHIESASTPPEPKITDEDTKPNPKPKAPAKKRGAKAK